MARTHRTLPSNQRGLSLVEMLVGVAGSLFLAATGAQLLGTHLHENRALLADTRVTQELRSAADLVVRELRRAGHWGGASAAVRIGGTGAASANPYAAFAPSAAASDAAAFRFSRDAVENNVVDDNEQFGFRLHDGVLEMQLGGSWQALTDAGSVRVTTFNLTPRVQLLDLSAHCARPCPEGSTTCPPRQEVRSIDIALTGESVGDATVSRSVRAGLRLRNDHITGACPV
jgi:prepilin peptidase dependent protein B